MQLRLLFNNSSRCLIGCSSTLTQFLNQPENFLVKMALSICIPEVPVNFFLNFVERQKKQFGVKETTYDISTIISRKLLVFQQIPTYAFRISVLEKKNQKTFFIGEKTCIQQNCYIATYSISSNLSYLQVQTYINEWQYLPSATCVNKLFRYLHLNFCVRNTSGKPIGLCRVNLKLKRWVT